MPADRRRRYRRLAGEGQRFAVPRSEGHGVFRLGDWRYGDSEPARHGRGKPAGVEARQRGVKSVEELNRARRPARLARPFEDEHAPPGPSQCRGSDETVGACADDDRVEALQRRHRPLVIWSAARRPDAPMMPPPG